MPSSEIVTLSGIIKLTADSGTICGLIRELPLNIKREHSKSTRQTKNRDADVRSHVF